MAVATEHPGGESMRGAIGPRSLETLRRIKQNLNVLQFEDPRLPIGD